MVADKEVDKVTDMVAGHGGWLIWPKLFRPEVYPACASSNLYVLICFHLTSKCLADPQLKNGFSDVGRQMVESRVIIVIINIRNFISEWQNYETKKWQISLNETINFLDNKGCICMLLNLKMRHKPNVNC